MIGVGAQGSTIASRLNDHPGVDEIVCVDCNVKETGRLERVLKKAKGIRLNASKVDDLVKAATSMDLTVNSLLNDSSINVKGVSISPRDLVSRLLPPAPSDPDSTRDAI